MRAVRTLINPFVLADMIYMPHGCEVKNVVWSHKRKCFELMIEGDSLPEEFEAVGNWSKPPLATFQIDHEPTDYPVAKNWKKVDESGSFDLRDNDENRRKQ